MTGWLVTGANGMLGRDLTDLLGGKGEQVTGLGRDSLDITDSSAVAAALDRHQPSVVVNCAAWTAVDDAEAHEADALLVNGDGAANLAAACARAGAAMVQLSTDYVFDGHASIPYAEGDPAAPRTAYGRTKLAGERAVLATLPATGYVLRTAWLYGAHGNSFVRTMIRLARKGGPVDVVTDQSGQPTWTADLAAQILSLVASGAPAGIYHGTSSGQTTWFGLAQEIFDLQGAGRELVRPTTSDKYQRPAPRPPYSVLSHDAWAKAGIAPIGDWRMSLQRAFPAVEAATA